MTPERNPPVPVDEDEAYWRDLVRAVPEPVESETRKARVWRRLTAPVAAVPWTRRPLLVTSFAVALIVMVGVAAAAVGGGRLFRSPPPAPSVPAPLPAAPPPAAAAPTPAAALPEPHPAPPAIAPATVQPSVAAPPAAPATESSMIYEAARANAAHDPQRAIRILDECSRTYPHGELAGEAATVRAAAAAALRRHGPAAPVQ